MKDRRIPKVIVHESSSSDTDEESTLALPEARAKDISSFNPMTDMSPNRMWDDSQFMSSNDDEFNSNYPMENTGLFLSSNINITPDFTEHDESDSIDISNEEKKDDTEVTKKGETSVTTMTTTSTTTTTNENQTQNLALKGQDDLSKYYILRHGRLYCNFNPSLTNTRGCQINFSERQKNRLISHLNIFHGCSIDQTGVTTDVEDNRSESSSHDNFYSPFNISPENDYDTLDLYSTATTSINSNEKARRENNMSLISINTQQKDQYPSFQNKEDMVPNCNAYLGDVFDNFLYSGASRLGNQSNITQDEKSNTVNSLNDQRTVSLTDIEYRQQQEQEPESITNKPTENKPDGENIASSTQPDIIPNDTIPKIEDTTPTPKRPIKKPLVSKITPKVLRSVTRKSTDTGTKKAPPPLLRAPPTPRPYHRVVNKTTTKKRGRKPSMKTNTNEENPPTKKKRVSVLDTDGPYSYSYLPTTSDNNTSTETTPELLNLTVEKREKTPIPEKRIVAGQEAHHVVPAVPTDGLWPFEYGYGFYMKKMYHCNVTRAIGACGCKATFVNRSVFIQHLNHVHRLHAGNAMESRESEEEGTIQEKMIDMLVAASLPYKFIENEYFVKMVKAIQGVSTEQEIFPSLESSQKLMSDAFDRRKEQLRSVLQAQTHLSFSIHIFRSTIHLDQLSVMITAFYIDKNWKIRDILIQFQLLNTKAELENCFLETIKSYGIEDKVYTIISPDFEIWEDEILNYKPSSLSISSQNEKTIMAPCLDQILELTKMQLADDIISKFQPLSKILSFRTKIKDESWVQSNVPEVLALKKFSQKEFTNFFALLKEFSTLEKVYDVVCVTNDAYNSLRLNQDDVRKIRKLLWVVETIDETNAWLQNATKHRYPTANKACLIYMELSNALFQLAQCYGCKNEHDMLFKRFYCDLVFDKRMAENINQAYAIIVKYRLLMEGSNENPTWQALALDAFSYSIYKARKPYYSKPKEMKTSELSSQLAEKKHIQLSINAQVTEIEKFINFKDNNEAAGTKKSKQKAIVPAPIVNTEEKDEIPSDFSEDAMKQFKESEKEYIQSEIQTESKGEASTMLTDLFHRDQYNLGQLNFWKSKDKAFYPRIAELTKQCFAVPTTSTECHRITDEAINYYAGIFYIYPNCTIGENQCRTLLYIWQKYLNY